jgi:2-phospho-L-lactate/phosphoenolpyruvate guanylyltransferase
MDLWAVVPVKERERSKERLAPLLSPELRAELMLAMFEDVLAALAAASGLTGILVATVDAGARRLAKQYGGRILEIGARDGHTGAVTAAVRLLAEEGREGILTIPGDIPLVTAAEIAALLSAHRVAPAFTIAPSRDERGSNAILCSPPDAVPLRFGEDSFFPHLRAAEARGIRPSVLRLPGIALDIDTPEDLAAFAARRSATRARALLAEHGMLSLYERAAEPMRGNWHDHGRDSGNG